MPLSTQQKKEIVDALAEKLSRSKTLIFTHFAKVGVEKVKKLRRNLMAKGVGFTVVKKTLLKIALEKAQLDTGTLELKKMQDAVGIALAERDQVYPARTVYAFSKEKDNEAFKVAGGVFDGRFVETEKIAALAKMSSQEELWARLLGQLKAPLSRLVYAVKAVADKRQAGLSEK